MWLSFQFRPGKTMVWIKERNSWYNVMRRMRGKGDLVKVGTNFPLVFQSLLDICRGMAACPTAGRLMVEAKEKDGAHLLLSFCVQGALASISQLGNRRR